MSVIDKIDMLAYRCGIDRTQATFLYDCWSRNGAGYGCYGYLGYSRKQIGRILDSLAHDGLLLVRGTGAQRIYHAKLDNETEHIMGEKKPDLIRATGLLQQHPIWHVDLWVLAYIAANPMHRTHLPHRMAQIIPKQLKACIKRLEETGLIAKCGFPLSRATLGEYKLTQEYKDDILDALAMKGKGFYPKSYTKAVEPSVDEAAIYREKCMPVLDHIRRIWPIRTDDAGNQIEWKPEDSAAVILACKKYSPAMVVAMASAYINHVVETDIPSNRVIVFRNYFSRPEHAENAYFRATPWLKTIYAVPANELHPGEIASLKIIEDEVDKAYLSGGMTGNVAAIASIVVAARGCLDWSDFAKNRKVA